MRIALFVLLFLAYPILPGPKPSVHAEITLADIIENVRRNEQLYENIDVVMNSTYDIGDRTPTDASIGDEKAYVVREMSLRTRFVSQGEWFRLERDGSSENSQGVISKDRIRAFDGETTRILEQNAVANISSERLEDEHFIRPHLLLIRHAHVAVPFSVYLSGHEAIRAHPNGHLPNDLTMNVTYEGEDEINGLKCHKVLVNVLLNSGEPHDGRWFWLAEERNYLPVRELAYTYRFSKSIPLGISVLHDLQEIAQGVWFPFDVETTSYNPSTIQRESRQKLQWRWRYVVEKAELNPQYDREFFSKVDFPDGTAVYEVEQGKINRSYRKGAPGAPDGPPVGRGWWWFLWINLAVFGVLTTILAFKKYRNA